MNVKNIAILNIDPSEIDDRLLMVIKELLSRDVEITLKTQRVELKEFDTTLPLDELIQQLEKAGYNEDFVSDLRVGFATSEIYGG